MTVALEKEKTVEECSGGSSAAPVAPAEPFMPRGVFEVVKKGCVDTLSSPQAPGAAAGPRQERWSRLRTPSGPGAWHPLAPSWMPSVARAVRTWTLGLSTSHLYLAPCLVPVTPEEHRKISVFWESTTRIFSTAPCILQSLVRCILRPDSLVFGVRHWSTRVWIFWKSNSGMFPYSVLLGSTVDTCSASVYEAFWVSTAENCGFSAVAVHRRSSTSLSLRSCYSLWSCLFREPYRFPSWSWTR